MDKTTTSREAFVSLNLLVGAKHIFAGAINCFWQHAIQITLS